MQEEDAFTLALVRHRFGHTAACVASCLISTPRQTIQQIIKATSLDPETVVSALVAMLQHDVISCQGPYNVQRPPKSVLSRNKQINPQTMVLYTGVVNSDESSSGSSSSNPLIDLTQHLAPPHQYEVTTNPLHLGDPSTKLIGNNASGFKQAVGYTAPTNSVHNPVLPLVRAVYESDNVQASIKQFLYSINSAMVRGLSRSTFYPAFIQELINQDARYIIEEFAFRGKLTIDLAIEYTVARILNDQDNAIRISHKNDDGTDPEYTAEQFNAMSPEELHSLPIFFFEKARNMKTICPDGTIEYSVSLDVLQQCDDIEFERYEAIIPRITHAFASIVDHYLLTPSFGFIDTNQLNMTTLEVTPQYTSTSTQIDKPDSASLSITTQSSGLASKKRKALSQASAHVTTMLVDEDDDDLFDENPSKRQKTSHFPSSSSSPAWNGMLASGVDMPSSLPERYQVYILNHDRFTLFLRGEIFAEYVARKVCPTAGLIIGALSFESLRYENPSIHNEVSIHVIKENFQRYVNIRAKMLPAVQKLLQTNPSHRPEEQTPADLKKMPQKTPNFASVQAAIEYYFLHQITGPQILRVMQRLTHDYSNILSKERQFVYSVGGTNSTDMYDDSEAHTTYVVHWDAIAASVRREYISTHLLTKHGGYAQRIFGVLCDYSRLEEKQVGDFGLIPKKVVKELLHTLLTEGFVELLEIPTSSDRLNPAKSFYLWGIDYNACGLNLLGIFYKAFTNAILRLDTERDRYGTHVDKMLLSKHLEVSDADVFYGRQYNTIYARFMHILSGQMKAIIMFKDLNPK